MSDLNDDRLRSCSLANRLSLADFVDLVAFLGDREAQEGLRGTASRIWTVGPFSRVLSKVDALDRQLRLQGYRAGTQTLILDSC